ncbi:MAG: YebC/PmpR family DNA-binding transcriptional regulator [Holosporales bacterium]|jgi:YebC/PmpR family DNA-binding regulatory protein|nr:YebC/PmpR family DNA-binding transcriptional regulator [Holosporales bacterium]
MSGHSQFKNIMYRKGAQDAKRAKVFAKIAREITVAAKIGGDDASANPRLRAALSLARENNMPKDNVERAIAKAAGADDGTNYDEVRYEGYGPGGIAIIVESLTDNRNRTASEVRSAFTKFGGSLGETGSVAFSFNRIGHLVYQKISGGLAKAFDFAIETGADNVEEFDDLVEITTSIDSFANVRDDFIKEFGDPIDSGLIWRANTLVQCSPDAKITIGKLVDILEDNDDVQKVFHNIDEE